MAPTSFRPIEAGQGGAYHFLEIARQLLLARCREKTKEVAQ
jgi:hypothetical protein